MFPQRVRIHGYPDFDNLRDLFRAEYVSGPPVIDIRGIRVHFGLSRPNNFRDFEHAAIGKEGVEGVRPEPYDIDRAECCIQFIRHVVASPDVSIYQADAPEDQRREMCLWQGQEAPGKNVERYCVVITYYLTSPDRARFLTSYPIKTAREFNERGRKAKVISSPKSRANAILVARPGPATPPMTADEIAAQATGSSRRERKRRRMEMTKEQQE